MSRDNASARMILGLVGEDVPLDVIAGWTDLQVDEAVHWASSAFVTAKGMPVREVKRPEFLKGVTA